MKYKDFEETEKLIKKVGYEEMPRRLETLITLRELVKLTLSYVLFITFSFLFFSY